MSNNIYTWGRFFTFLSYNARERAQVRKRMIEIYRWRCRFRKTVGVNGPSSSVNRTALFVAIAISDYFIELRG